MPALPATSTINPNAFHPFQSQQAGRYVLSQEQKLKNGRKMLSEKGTTQKGDTKDST